MKPMQTGAVSPELDGDEAFYKNALSEDVTIATFSTYPEPLAPSIAARRSESILDIDQLVEKSLTISAAHDISFFEGAGGLCSYTKGTIPYSFDVRAANNNSIFSL